MSSPLDAVPAGVISLSDDLRILAANRGMVDLVGRTREELLGAPIDVVLSAPSRILFQTHVYPALTADGRVEEVFLTLAPASGEPVPVLLNAVRSAAPRDATFDAVVVRVRARARWETELVTATRALEREQAASRRLADDLAAALDDVRARHAEEQRVRQFRDAFVGIIGHELRTPMTTIYGMSRLLSRGRESLPAEVLAERLADIEAESERLIRLTEDLLVLSRAEGGTLAVATAPVAIGHLVRAVVERERARSPTHRFDMAVPARLPLVLGDDVHVEQVLRNYLSNAAKYSPHHTTIHVTATEEGDGVSVRVIDEGPGLPGPAPEQLFELFYRAPDAIRQKAGAGIGLFVSRELVAAMGGRVWAAPGSTTGAEFGFWLRSAGDSDPDAEPSDAAAAVPPTPVRAIP